MIAAFLAVIGMASAEVDVEAPDFVPGIPEGENHGPPMAINVTLNWSEPIDGHLRVQLLTLNGSVVSRTWNHTIWTYSRYFSRSPHVISDDGTWTGFIYVNLYNYSRYGDVERERRVMLKVDYEHVDGSRSEAYQQMLDVIPFRDLGHVHGFAFNQRSEVIRAIGSMRTFCISENNGVDEGNPSFRGYFSMYLPSGEWNISSAGEAWCVNVTPGTEIAISLGNKLEYGARISEMMIDPVGNDAEGEWIEIETSVDLFGWRLTDGEFSYIFNHTSEKYVLLSLGTPPVDGRGEIIRGPDGPQLANSGDEIYLVAPDYTLVDMVVWGSGKPLPVEWSGDGVDTICEGWSIQRFSDTNTASDFISIWWGNVTPGYTAAPHHSEHLRIVEVYYYGFAPAQMDEYVVVENTGRSNVNLSGCEITDLEDVSTLPPIVLAPGERIYLARNATWLRGAIGVRAYEMTLQLANSGDEVLLRRDKGVIDAVVWSYERHAYHGPGWSGPPVPGVHAGEILRRGERDTNTSEDWIQPRIYRIGQTDLSPQNFTCNYVRAFVSPETALSNLLDFIDSATNHIWIELYEFGHPRIRDHLLSAILRGVDVRLLLEGSPVGWRFENVSLEEFLNSSAYEEAYVEKALLSDLVDAGAQVRFMSNRGGNQTRYRFVHAKFAVRDSSEVLISSENWKRTGYPEEPVVPDRWFGNRGWGVILNSTELASYFETVFLADWSREFDLVSFGTPPYTPPPEYFLDLWHIPESDGSYIGTLSSAEVFGSVEVIPVLSPDTSNSDETVIGILRSARKRIYVELLDCNLNWSERGENRYLEALKQAALRGVSVRILLDSRYVDPRYEGIDNYDVMLEVNRFAEEMGLNMEARLVTLDGLEKVHNKGMVVDDYVLISSINWGFTSVFQNREAGVIIRSPELADFFTSAFLRDWNLSVLDTLTLTCSLNGTSISIYMIDLAGETENVTVFIEPLNGTFTPLHQIVKLNGTAHITLITDTLDNATALIWVERDGMRCPFQVISIPATEGVKPPAETPGTGSEPEGLRVNLTPLGILIISTLIFALAIHLIGRRRSVR